MGTPPETSKQQPCPDKILDDIGGALGMGVVGLFIDEPLPPNGLPAQHVPLSSDSEAQSAQSWFAGFFRKKDDPVSSTGGSETKVLESFDAPPMPNFEYR